LEGLKEELVPSEMETFSSLLSWEEVRTMNEVLCKQQSTGFHANQSLESARKVWMEAVRKNGSLKDLLELCRTCHEMAPFTFNNGNTFAAVARKLVEDWVKTLPSVEAQIVHNTIGHYVVGMISRKELEKVLNHFRTSWSAFVTAKKLAGSAAGMPIISVSTAVPATAPTQAGVRSGLDGAMLTAPQ
jgi:hypothetical protein